LSTNTPPKIKQRIVGAVVLLTVALVLLPNLLRGPKDDRLQPFITPIPPEPILVDPLPIAEKDQYAVPELPVPASEMVSGSTADDASIPALNEEIPLVAAPPLVQTLKPKAANVQSEKLAVPQRQVAPRKSEPAAKETATTAPSNPKAQLGSDEWMIQVGSFGSQANALFLRDQLQAKHFDAVVEKSSEAGKASYRVRVGPEIYRKDAVATQARLKKEMGLDGLVMRRVQ